jgi:CRP-like cAMP-binding protein
MFMNLPTAALHLEDHPFVAGASPEFVRELARFDEPVEFEEGELLFHQRDYVDKFYLLMAGKVNIELHAAGSSHHIVIQRLGFGDVIGWSWLFAPFCAHFTARAASQGSAIRFNGPALLVKAEENPAFGYELMKRMAAHLIRRLVATSERLITAEALAPGRVSPVEECAEQPQPWSCRKNKE